MAGPLIVCAPNAFKGTLSAAEAAAAMAEGVRRARPDAAVTLLPVADGGDGTLDVLLGAAGRRGRIERHAVTGPAGTQVSARLGWLDAVTAVVELAEATGMRLLPAGTLRPLTASSRGAGELLGAALDGRARSVVVGVGGSASTDGGAGALMALGLRLHNAGGAALGDGGGALAAVATADAGGLDPRLAQTEIIVAVDTSAPLLGGGGAARLFAPQKGATLAEVALLEGALERFAGVLEHACAVDGHLRSAPGGGAAGGTAYGLAALARARLLPGAELVCDTVGMDAALRGAALVVTGEGRLDRSTATGKAPFEVARRAARAGVPCVVITGSVSGPVDPVFAAAFELAGDPRHTSAVADAGAAVAGATERAVRKLLGTG